MQEQTDPIETALAGSGQDRRSERWDIKNIFRNYFFLAGTQIGSAAFSFIIVWFVTRFWGTGGYGNVVAVLSAAQIILVFVNWTGVALARHGVEEFVETGKISRAFVNRGVIFLFNSILLLLSSVLWMPLITTWLKLPKEAASFILSYFIAAAAWLHIQNGLQAAKLLRLQGFLLLGERVLILLSLILTKLIGPASWMPVTIAYISAAILMALIGFTRLRPYITFNGSLSKEWIRKIFAFSLPLFPYTLTIFFSTNYLDAFFISKYLRKEELGVYSVAYQVSGVLLQFPTLVGALLMPMFVTLRANQKEAVVHTYLQDILPLLTYLWGLFTFFCAAACCIILPQLFGKELEHAGLIIWILITGSTLAMPALMGYSPFVTAAAAVFISFPMALVTATTNITGNMLLIPRWGLTGSAWATVMAFGASLLFLVALMNRRFRLKHTWLFQAALPSICSIIYYSWRGNMWETLVVSLGASAITGFLYRKSIIQSVQRVRVFHNHFRQTK